jgi:hypothetical protein
MMTTGRREGTLRLMTLGEIAMARQFYGDAIVYSRVWIHCDSYFPFGLQHPDYVMAPNGEIWYRKELYHHDFSHSTVNMTSKYTFMHEMGHVWQHQHGQWVRTRGLFSWAADYFYQLDKEKIMDYSLEQQASILADYWVLLIYGINTWLTLQGENKPGKYRGKEALCDIPSLYRRIVTGRR